ncbi:MAG: SAM-dependent methyltransferase [Patiriisocius sp.]|jgi:SAM-dependent methyltransferase
MKENIKRFISKVNLFGFDAYKFKSSLRGLSFYNKDFKEIKRQKGKDDQFPFGKKMPILDEREETSGNMTGHYFHQDLYVARRIFKKNPENHLDIGSRTDGFVAHVASYRKIEVMDIRPQDVNIENIEFRQADLMILPKDLLSKYDSISSLHVIEHFGLGRYGDPIDYFGHLKAIENITKMLSSGGRFYFSTPIGRQRIEFNAHRIFSVNYLISLFQKDYSIDRFSYVDDQGDFFENAPIDDKSVEENYNFNYGCGIFELVKH